MAKICFVLQHCISIVWLFGCYNNICHNFIAKIFFHYVGLYSSLRRRRSLVWSRDWRRATQTAGRSDPDRRGWNRRSCRHHWKRSPWRNAQSLEQSRIVLLLVWIIPAFGDAQNTGVFGRRRPNETASSADASVTIQNCSATSIRWKSCVFGSCMSAVLRCRQNEPCTFVPSTEDRRAGRGNQVGVVAVA